MESRGAQDGERKTITASLSADIGCLVAHQPFELPIPELTIECPS
jgi:hypothetical protein